MANAAGMLKESIWRDKEFRALPRTAQATYAQLLSQKDLDRAGMQPLQVSKWAKGCDDITEADIWADLKLLESRRFIFVDEDSDEVFIRSYMRHSQVTKYPQFMKAALRCAGMVASTALRQELADELRRLHRAEASELADELDPEGTVRARSANRPETLPAPSANGSGTVNPSGTLPSPSGVGEGVGELKSVGGSVGRDESENPPTTIGISRFCEDHPEGTDRACLACRKARLASDRADLAQREAQAEAERQAREEATSASIQAIVECERCDDDGYIGLQVCAHRDHASAETRAAARAKVAATISKGGEA
jgi:hypothetical protein